MSGTRAARAALLLSAALTAGACDGRQRGEGVPPSAISDSSILADTAKRDVTDQRGAVPHD